MAEKIITIRLDDKQLEKLEEMTLATGLDRSKIIRVLIDNAKFTSARFASEINPAGHLRTTT